MTRHIRLLASISLLLGVLAFTVGCKCKLSPYNPTPPTLDSMDPDCGPVGGGTVVVVEGTRLSFVTSVEIAGVAQDLNSAESEQLTFTTKPTPEGTYEVTLHFSYDLVCENGDFYETKTGSMSPGEFTFVDSLTPVVFDAHPELTDYVNTEPYEGKCGGGYWIEIYGEDFVQTDAGEIPMVVFNGKEVYAPDVEYDPSEPGVLRVKVPRCGHPLGCKGVWVDVVVRNPPYDCGLDSVPPAQFFYKQDPCEEYDDSLQFAYAEVDGGPVHLDAGDILSASAGLFDLAVACERTSEDSGSLVVLQGDGEGYVTRADGLDFTTDDARPTAVSLGDFDGNDYLDAAVTLNSGDEGLSQVAVFFNDGSGYANERSVYITLGSDLTDLEAVDLDGDGDDDIAVVSRGTGELLFLEQTSPETLDAGSMAAVAVSSGIGESDGPFALAIGDFDGGGSSDDLAVATHADTIELFVSASGSGSPVAAADTASTGSGLIGIATGEFYGGSGDDLAVVCEADENVELYEVSSGVISASPVSHGLSGGTPTAFCVGEFDGDGRDDIAVAGSAGLGETDVEVLELGGTVLGDSYSLEFEIDSSELLGAPMNSNDPLTREDLVMAQYFPSLFGIVQIAINTGDGFE